MTSRRQSPRRLRALGVALTILASGCGASGNPGLLSTTCAEFLEASDETQMNVAAQWANPARDGTMTDQSKFMALGIRASLGNYCGQDGHEDEEIGDLETAAR